MVDSGASSGQASAPRGMGVGGHDTELCGLPLDGGAGLWRQCQGTMPEASTSVANAKSRTESPFDQISQTALALWLSAISHPSKNII